MEYKIEIYRTASGKVPFTDWHKDLTDRQALAIIRTRLDRVERGNFGDHEPVGNGVYELRIDYGPGYRIYFCKIGKTIVLLLSAGTKRRQQADILRACEYRADYNSRCKSVIKERS